MTGKSKAKNEKIFLYGNYGNYDDYGDGAPLVETKKSNQNTEIGLTFSVFCYIIKEKQT